MPASVMNVLYTPQFPIINIIFNYCQECVYSIEGYSKLLKERQRKLLKVWVSVKKNLVKV